MKILLLNDNPVVNKLVTLSAQKTSDELEIVTSIDEIRSNSCDLLVVDDASYTKEVFDELSNKIRFSESLFISARDTKEVKEFSSTIKKPFLPTDLVELFSTLSKKVDTIDLDDEVENLDDDFSFDTISLEEDNEDISEKSLNFDEDDFSLEDDEDDFSFENHDRVLDDDEAQKVKDLLEETSEDLIDDEDLDFGLEDDLNDLEDDILLSDDNELEELSSELENEDIHSSVLDDKEAQKVKDLLDETSEESIEDELDFNLEDDLSDDVLLSDGEVEDDELNSGLTDSQKLNDEDDLEDTFNLDDDIDLEAQIKSAVNELSDEDLSSEVNEETLLSIAESEINSVDSLDSLTSKELKLAIGEEVMEDEFIQENEPLKEEVLEKSIESNGVDALKKLLTALNDKEVAASMKGMTISINITLGANS